jgi:DNA-binding NtrC family response regulator
MTGPALSTDSPPLPETAPGSLRILVAEDEDRLRRLIEILLGDRGHTITLCKDGAEAWDAWQAAPGAFDLVLTDVRMPHMDGLELLTRLRTVDPLVPVIVITAFASIENAVEAMRLGATDYLTKPFEEAQLHLAIERASRVERLQRENERLKAAVRDGHTIRPIAESEVMRQVLETARAVAATNSTVLITGESGTGKEVITRYIHDHSPRASGPFIAVNCAAIPESLFESELFGHEKGSFTGATDRRIGKFEQANGGTLFLDEIGELDLAVQAKVLRALESRQIERVGGNRTITCDIRVIAATNRDLAAEVRAGRFREDLYFRILVFPLYLPPLRQRIADIPPLVHAIARRWCRTLGRPMPEIPDATMQWLQSQPWPGNIRELQNSVERALILQRGDVLLPETFLIGLPPPLGPTRAGIGAADGTAVGSLALAGGPESPTPVGVSTGPILGNGYMSSGAMGSAPVGGNAAAGAVTQVTVGWPLATVASTIPTAAGEFYIPETGFDLETHERQLLEQALRRCGGNKSRTARMLGLTRATLRYRLEKFNLCKDGEREEPGD